MISFLRKFVLLYGCLCVFSDGSHLKAATNLDSNLKVNTIVFIVVGTNQLQETIEIIKKNFQESTVIINEDNSKIKEMEVEIRMMESRFTEKYDGVPQTYTGNGSVESQKTLDRLILIWNDQKKDKTEIDLKRTELSGLRKNR